MLGNILKKQVALDTSRTCTLDFFNAKLKVLYAIKY